MIVAPRTVLVLLALAGACTFGLTGCLGLPEPAPATAPSLVGDTAPVFTLARTGPSPGTLSLGDLTRGTAAVLVFYRGEW